MYATHWRSKCKKRKLQSLTLCCIFDAGTETDGTPGEIIDQRGNVCKTGHRRNHETSIAKKPLQALGIC